MQEAVNLLEGLRYAATITLDMEEEDLQIVHLPRSDGRCDSIIYDPMPGGSGLLSQILERTGGDKEAAAQKLNISLATLYRKLPNAREKE